MNTKLLEVVDDLLTWIKLLIISQSGGTLRTEEFPEGEIFGELHSRELKMGNKRFLYAKNQRLIKIGKKWIFIMRVGISLFLLEILLLSLIHSLCRVSLTYNKVAVSQFSEAN